jgi:hypothetical protein
MPQPLYPGERAPGTHWIGGCVGLRASLNDVETGKFLTLPGLERNSTVHYNNVRIVFFVDKNVIQLFEVSIIRNSSVNN